MKIKKYYFVYLLILLPIISLSCYNDYGLNANDYDVVITFRNNEVNFQQYRTYAMPDSVVRMTDSSSSPPATTYDQTILDEVEKQMTALGYTRVEPDTNNLPDVFVLVGVTSSDYYALGGGYWWGWWGWYPGWGYYPGWGGGWYPGYGYAYSYTTGTLLLTMLDPARSNEENKTLAVVWSGALNGILESSESSNRTRIIGGIDNMFTQSPYLKIYR